MNPDLPAQPAHLVEPWRALKASMVALLAQAEKDAAWIERLQGLASRLRRLSRQDPDVALYVMQQTAGNESEHYGAHHSMYCAVIGELCSAWLEWPTAEADALLHAALSMNIGMLELQDSLAAQAGPLTPEQRRRIDVHAQVGAELLLAAGVADDLWIETVRRHHRPTAQCEAPQPGASATCPATLLQRIDVFTAKLSRRKTRAAASAARAARDACLDAAGHLDTIGATVLRVIGLYPPGSFVELANGDSGVVLRRGTRAHTPVVGCLRRPDGAVLLRPQLRDTALAPYAVRRSLLCADLRMTLNHERVLGALLPAHASTA